VPKEFFFYVFFVADPTKVNANFIKLSNNLDDKDTIIPTKNKRKIKKDSTVSTVPAQ